jgi:polar amino acid transport system permease protein
LGIGLAISSVLAVAGAFGGAPWRQIANLYVFIVRGVPLLVTMLFLFFAVGTVWGGFPASLAAVVAMGLYSGAYLTEIFRGALVSIPRGQIDAARSIGLRFWSRVALVIAPQAIRRALPSFVNVAVDMVKASTLVAALGVGDLLMSGQEIGMRTLLIPEVYLFLWLVYLAINLGLSALGRWLEGRMRHVVF